MKIYLDDERSTPDGWRRLYWPDEAIELSKTDTVTDISLDHDLGDDDRRTGGVARFCSTRDEGSFGECVGTDEDGEWDSRD